MKKLLIMICAFIILSLSACIGSTSNDEKGASVTESLNDSEDENIMEIVSLFDYVQDIGTSLFDCFEGFDLLESNEKYNRIKEAETLTSEMATYYESILNICKEFSEYANVEYQTKLLKNLIPQPIENNSQAIKNATILYQMYFQQMSSSFFYLAEDMRLISEGKKLENRILYYDNMPKIVRPDTIICGITYVEDKTEDGVIKYTYNSGEDATDAQMNYNLYLIALGMDTGFTLQFDGTAVYVFDGDTMVSALMAGTDAEIGNFFMVTFPE